MERFERSQLEGSSGRIEVRFEDKGMVPVPFLVLGKRFWWFQFWLRVPENGSSGSCFQLSRKTLKVEGGAAMTRIPHMRCINWTCFITSHDLGHLESKDGCHKAKQRC